MSSELNSIEQNLVGSLNQLSEAFACPETHADVVVTENGLSLGNEVTYPFLNERVVDFISPSTTSEQDAANLDMYNSPASTDIYRNFLDWLFAAFNEDEMQFRKRLLHLLNLPKGGKVLITSVGLGDDIQFLQDIVGPEGQIHGQDLSKAMVLLAESKNAGSNIMFSVSNANKLPYKDRYFDGVFHFGGINLFGNVQKAIAEMERVCKVGGRVVFGDESVAPHLRSTEYAKIAINNNKLWDAKTPIDLLPHNAIDIQLNYVLGNCFYVIGFNVGDGFPYMNIDWVHKGTRGGTARTRYFGQLEGVNEDTKAKVLQVAKARNMSVHDLLEEIINKSI